MYRIVLNNMVSGMWREMSSLHIMSESYILKIRNKEKITENEEEEKYRYWLVKPWELISNDIRDKNLFIKITNNDYDSFKLWKYWDSVEYIYYSSLIFDTKDEAIDLINKYKNML